jgi:cyclopropane-fatty-acyl-phospholipid synthase
LAERAKIVMRDYRDEAGVYDGIASIEMFEAVGEKYWPKYFRTLHERLRGGRFASLQIITIADPLFSRYRRGADFIQKYIFPGGMLPSRLVLRREFAAAGLKICSSMELSDSYSRTLREWRETFNARWGEISKLGFDQRFHRMWNFYLAASAAGFYAGTTSVSQFGLRRTP